MSDRPSGCRRRVGEIRTIGGAMKSAHQLPGRRVSQDGHDGTARRRHAPCAIIVHLGRGCRSRSLRAGFGRSDRSAQASLGSTLRWGQSHHEPLATSGRTQSWPSAAVRTESGHVLGRPRCGGWIRIRLSRSRSPCGGTRRLCSCRFAEGRPDRRRRSARLLGRLRPRSPSRAPRPARLTVVSMKRPPPDTMTQPAPAHPGAPLHEARARCPRDEAQDDGGHRWARL